LRKVLSALNVDEIWKENDMDLDRLEKMFQITGEVVVTYNPEGGKKPLENETEAIRKLNDELWSAGYMTWILQKGGRYILSIRPRSARKT
jgi:hypothetical protein